MRAPVDVLAVMDEAAHCLNSSDYRDDRDALLEARDAVADLIEADREYDDAFEAASGFVCDGYEDDSYGEPGSEFYRCLACGDESSAGVLNNGRTHEPDCVRRRYEVAIQRRVAALARVTPMTPEQQAEQAGVCG